MAVNEYARLEEMVRQKIAGNKKDVGGYEYYLGLMKEAIGEDRGYGVWGLNRLDRMLHRCVAENIGRDMGLCNALIELDRRALLAAAPWDFDSFLMFLEFNRAPDEKFYPARRKVLQPIVQAFQNVNDGKLDLLTVSQPKRTGKTTLGLLFVLFRAGQHLNGSSICSGVGNDLVKFFYTGCLDILSKPEEYLFYEVFPQARLVGTNADEKTIHLEKKSVLRRLHVEALTAR